MAEVRLATLEDAYSLAPRLRKQDVAEIAAYTGEDPFTALRDGLMFSTVCNALVRNGKPIAMGGVGPLPIPGVKGVGAVWLLGSDEIADIQVEFLRMSRGWVDAMHGSDYPLLMNFVDARNARHIKWLKWCGFTFLRKHAEFGVAKKPFYEFVRLQCARQ